MKPNRLYRDQQLLAHVQRNLPISFGVHFAVKPDRWSRSLLAAVDDVLCSLGGLEPGAGSLETHWQFLEERGTGRRPWDTWVEYVDCPRFGTLLPAEFGERMRRHQASQLTVSNAQRIGLRTYTLGRLHCMLDMLNPGNELRLPLKARDPEYAIMSLLFVQHPKSPEPTYLVPDRLIEEQQFYFAVERLIDVTQPAHVFGGNCCLDVYHVAFAYLYADEPIDGAARFWDYYYTLMVIPIERLAPPPLPMTLMGPMCKGRWMLMQATPGLSDPDLTSLAKAFGMTPAHALFRDSGE